MVMKALLQMSTSDKDLIQKEKPTPNYSAVHAMGVLVSLLGDIAIFRSREPGLRRFCLTPRPNSPSYSHILPAEIP